MVDTCSHTVAAGGYVLGVLSPRESNEFHRHASACPYCRREIVELTPVARFLEPLKALDTPGSRH